MSCPHFSTSPTDDEEQQRSKDAEGGVMTYSQYLKLDKLLGAQVLASEQNNNLVHDEHLFIITHQAYELWFKQIIYDLDIVLQQFQKPSIDERRTLMIVSKLERIVKILKLLVDQILVLETMTPLDFAQFRKYLTPASGFQSIQFRMLENKLGIRSPQRVNYNAQNYLAAFEDQEDHKTVLNSENEKSLFQLVEKWLERTPGVDRHIFFNEYCQVVAHRRRSHGFVRFNYGPSKTLRIDAKWSATLQSPGVAGSIDNNVLSGSTTFVSTISENHVLLVQRMIGTKIGWGGSSAYMYLKSTCSDRYKVFMDLCNLSAYIIPDTYIPPLSRDLSRKLSCTDMVHDRIEFELANRRSSSSYLIDPENMHGNDPLLGPQCRHSSQASSSVPTTDYSDDGASTSELS